MCGRFTQRATAAELIEIFKLVREMHGYAPTPRYNIAPTQQVAVIRQTDKGRELSPMHWGLIPSWSKDPKMGARMINARGESVSSKPSFRSAFRKRRCLIPADGFYEWKQLDKKTKQPYYITMPNGKPFAFAGLWEHWEQSEPGIDSCTIITTDANQTMRPLHDRMPVILSPEDYDRWLDPKQSDPDQLQSLLSPTENDALEFQPVSTLVNSPRNDSPECVEPVPSSGKE